MKLLFTLRPEILSILITSFLIAYSIYCNKYRVSGNDFLLVAAMCLGHCVTAALTEITVNTPETPAVVNDILHILFFGFSLFYALFYFRYALNQIFPGEKIGRRLMFAANIITVVCLGIMVVSPIGYARGEYTDYSYGTGPTVCYMMGFLFLISADIIFFVYRKKINEEIIKWLVPVSLVALGILEVQIVIPEYLATAHSLTLSTLGLFFVIENPVGKFKNRAYVDELTRTYNRNGYEYDLQNQIPKKLEKEQLIYVLADINGLKAVNDNLGHMDGDLLLMKTAEILHEELHSAYRLYRLGGDEFAALYFNTDPSVVEAETEEAVKRCRGIQLSAPFAVGLSVGSAEQVAGETVADAEKRAEKVMYRKKSEYYKALGIERRLI